MVKKKIPETKWQTLGKTIIKAWWKIIIIILAAGFIITGFSFSFGKLKCSKDAIIKDKPLNHTSIIDSEGPR